METYIPIIQGTLTDWIALTLINPFYAGALAAVVFLLTATLYSIRVAFLKSNNKASEKARIEIQVKLNETQQNIEAIQQELLANSEQMQTANQLAQDEAARANELENRLSVRNGQIARIIQSLATSFDLGERPLPVMENVEAEELWQQHERVINFLVKRVQSEQQAKTQFQESYQAETLKHTEKDALLETMRLTLALQTSQLQSIEQQRFDFNGVKEHLIRLEERLNSKDALIAELEKNKLIFQVKEQSEPEPISILQEAKETLNELDSTNEEVLAEFFSDKEQPLNPVKEQFSVLSKQFTNILDQASSESSKVDTEISELNQDTEEFDSAPIVEETMLVSSVKEQKSGMVGKLKNMFGKAKKKPIQVIPEVSDIRQIIVENQSAPSELESLILTTDKNQVSSESTEIEAEITELNQDIEEVESISIVEETILVKSAKEQKSGVVGKLKNMFGKAKKKPIVVVPEVLESKDISVESDQESPEAEQRSAFAASGWK